MVNINPQTEVYFVAEYMKKRRQWHTINNTRRGEKYINICHWLNFFFEMYAVGPVQNEIASLNEVGREIVNLFILIHWKLTIEHLIAISNEPIQTQTDTLIFVTVRE